MSLRFFIAEKTTYSMLRNSASGPPDLVPTGTWKTMKSGLRPAKCRPEGKCRCFPGRGPAKIRPGRPIYGPEALLRNIEYPGEGLGGRFEVVVVDFWWICLVFGVLFAPIKPLLAPIRPLLGSIEEVVMSLRSIGHRESNLCNKQPMT